MASKFRNHLGYALRVRAVYHRLSGSVERAETDFIESEKILTEQGRLYELARTTLEWAQSKSRDGTLTEVFGMGTAAVISPVSELSYKKQNEIILD